MSISLPQGDIWVGISIKPNTIEALRAFDAKRYAAVAMPNPRQSTGMRCR